MVFAAAAPVWQVFIYSFLGDQLVQQVRFVFQSISDRMVLTDIVKPALYEAGLYIILLLLL